ncbi:hypothetical protein BKA56DRAFT_246790 [Ilyonectria sp. MPI-CAGE-AT-0026]|nr:hypothetical protein BKA56DRAFT_246790 [Ilyonectria sp. MPI-CAGE-AT-0026]
MNAATVCFGEFQKTVDGLNQMIRASYNKDRNSSSKLQGFGVILIIFGILCATSGLAVGGVVAVGGATVLTDQMGKKKKIRAKTGNVKEFEGLIGKLGDALKDAKLALTAVYCSQVLKMPLELMARNQQKIILKALGVDVEKLQTPEYDEELVAMRMDRFCKVYKSLEKARGAVADDLCVQDRRLGSRRR